MNQYEVLDESLMFLNEGNITDRIKDSVKSILAKIKRAVINLIDKIQNFLKTCKDSNVKTTINTILTKAKAALGDVESIEKLNEAELEKQKDRVNKLSYTIRSLSLYYKMVSMNYTVYDTLRIADINSWIKPKLEANKSYVAYFALEKDVIDDIKRSSPVEVIKMHVSDDHVIACYIYDKDKKETVDYHKWGFGELSDELKQLLDSNNGSVLVENN